MYVPSRHRGGRGFRSVSLPPGSMSMASAMCICKSSAPRKRGGLRRAADMRTRCCAFSSTISRRLRRSASLMNWQRSPKPRSRHRARRLVALRVAGGAAAGFAAKAASATIPIVLVSGSDVVRLGLAASPSRPGGNVTGVTFTSAGLMSKKLDLLRELVPLATTIGYLAEDGRAYASDSPLLPAIGKRKSEILAAAGASGWQVVVAEIGSDRDYEAAFAKFVEHHADALVVVPSAIFASDVDDIVALTLRHEIPTMFERRADVIAAGLISYGASRMDAWRQGGIYVGQILKGAKPADMPVMQSTKLALIINLTIAKSLGLTIQPSLLAQADEVIQ